MKENVFQSKEFNRIIEEILVRKVSFIQGEDHFCVIHPSKKFKFLKINYCPDPRLECVYGGIRGRGDKKVLKKGLWHITTMPGEDISEYISYGFKARERYTSILNLEQSEEELWRNLDKKTRNLVRKSRKSGIKIGISKNIDKYYPILKEVYDKASLEILPKEFYARILEKLGVLFLVEYEGKIIAGAIFLKYKNNVYYWNGASYKEYNHLAPNNLLQWKFIKWAKRNNFKTYDLLGLDIPSIAEFKEGFGGERVKFYTLMSKPLYFLKRVKDLIS